MRHRRLHRRQGRGRRHRGRAQAPRVPRLRLRRGGRAGAGRPRGAARGRAHQGAGRRSSASGRCAGSVGIGHTRWATHGRPTDENAHPHTDGSGSLVVVHNGIIENYLPIKERLSAEGHVFTSETDTEVIAHLIERHLEDTPRLEEAVRRALRELTGSYAIVVLSQRTPGSPRGGQARRGQRGGGTGAGRDLPRLGHPRASSPTPATWSSSRTRTWRW